MVIAIRYASALFTVQRVPCEMICSRWKEMNIYTRRTTIE